MVDHMGYSAEPMMLNAMWLTNSPTDVKSATVNGNKAVVHKNNVSVNRQMRVVESVSSVKIRPEDILYTCVCS